MTAAVSIGPRDGGGFGIAVKLHIEDKTLPQAELAALVKEAHEKVCPYSHATRGNVDVQLEVVGGIEREISFSFSSFPRKRGIRNSQT